MKEIKPKKTVYRGQTYRSMAEAKTAEALDRLGLQFEYECAAARGPQYVGGQYTPDFYADGLRSYIEVAGIWDRRHEANARQYIIDMNLYQYDEWEHSDAPRFFRVDGDGYIIPVFSDGSCGERGDGFVNRCSACGSLSLMGHAGSYECPHCGSWDGDRYIDPIGDNIFDVAGVKRYGGR